MAEHDQTRVPGRTEVKSVCCYCGVGCGVIVDADGASVLGVRGDPGHPANFGRLCTKGGTLRLTAAPEVQRQVRAQHPELRLARDAPRRRASWDDTLEYLARRFDETIRRHGPDSVAFYISGQLLTEDYYVFNKLAKGLIGTNNIDSNSRLCMSSAVAAYKQTLGADAPPACYEDIDHASVIFIAGSNTAYAHPILYRRIEQARARNPDLKLIVVDPRRTDTAQGADLFLPILPGTDVALFNGMLHVCMAENLIDRGFIDARTDGFEALRKLLADYDPQRAAAICGIETSELVRAARWFGGARAALSLYCQGLNQSACGVDKNSALINLHLATRQIGKPGAGPFSLTGQANAMGGREVGGMANLLSAHRNLADPADRAEVARLWDVPEVPSRPGKTAIEMFEALRSGEIKIVWIACTNPAQSLPDQALVRRALESAQLVIVQDAFHTTASAAYADVLLPATTWPEKDGTVTNSERRISRVRAALPKPGEARHDWEIAAGFGRKLEALRGRDRSLFGFADSEAVWNEHRESTRGRDLDIGGLSYRILEQRGPQQWPFPAGAERGRQRLYEDGVFATANGRAAFVPAAYRPAAEPVERRYPFHLTTGRLRDQWHGMSRTGSVAQLFAHAGEPCVELAPADMRALRLEDGDLVHVTSRRGMQIFPARGEAGMRAGQAFIAMHWGEEYLSGRGGGDGATHGVNALTLSACDPVSRQPELKHAAVKILKAELPWRGVVFGWFDPDQALRAQSALRAFMRRFAYAACTLFGHDRSGVLFRAADDYAAPPELVRAIEAVFGIEGAGVLRYDDRKRGVGRHLLLGERKLDAAALYQDVAAEGWLRQCLEARQPVEDSRRMLLTSGSGPAEAGRPRGRIVCNCFNLAEGEIRSALKRFAGAPDARLDALQKEFRCGTACGSCLPELKRIVAL